MTPARSLIERSEAVAKAPTTMALVVCPECGRTNRWTPLKKTGKHYTMGKLCSGRPVTVTYHREVGP